MSDSTIDKKFIFSETIDADYLFSLYAGDYPYLEEVFATTLYHFDADVDAIKEAYEAENVADLKRAIHKIKPTFGFVGLMQVQQACKNFEDICQKATSTVEIKDSYKLIIQTLAEGKATIEAEYYKLKAFNESL